MFGTFLSLGAELITLYVVMLVVKDTPEVVEELKSEELTKEDNGNN